MVITLTHTVVRPFLMVSIIGLMGCYRGDTGAAPCGDRPYFDMWVSTVSDSSKVDAQGVVRLHVGQSVAIHIHGIGVVERGAPLANVCPVASVTWASSTNGVVTVAPTTKAEDWTLTALAPGSTQITASVSWNAGTSGTTAGMFLGVFGSGLPRKAYVPLVVD